VFNEQLIYVRGYPCGLPLKYEPRGMVKRIKDAYVDKIMKNVQWGFVSF
jgi:hypothetical protein